MFVNAFERELLGRSGTIAPDSLCHSYSKLTAVAIDALICEQEHPLGIAGFRHAHTRKRHQQAVAAFPIIVPRSRATSPAAR